MVAPTLSALGIAILAGAALFVFIAEPLLLGVSASMAGERAPGWFKAFLALIVASFASLFTGVAYSLTLGLLLTRLGTAPAMIGAVGVSLLTTGIVYSAMLRIPVMSGARVAVIHSVLSALLLGGLRLLLGLLLG